MERALLAAGVSAHRIARARLHAARMRSTLGAALVELGDLSEDALTRALSDAYGLPPWNGHVSQPLAEHLGASTCRYHLFVPVARSHDRVMVATGDPTNESMLNAVRYGTGALYVDVVVAADAAIVRQLDALFPFPSTNDLSDLAKEEQAGGVPRQLVSFLFTATARAGVTAMRIELGPEPRVLLEVDGTWCPPSWMASVSRRTLGGAAKSILEMAGIGDHPAPADGELSVVVGRGGHVGSVFAFDVAHTRTTGGLVVVARRAPLRPTSKDGDDAERAVLALGEQASAALGHDAIDEARPKIAELREKALALDGEGGPLMFFVRELECQLQLQTGQWAIASTMGEEIAGRRNTIGSRSETQHLSTAATCARLAGDAARAAMLATRAIASAERMFGAPDIHGAYGLYDLALAQLALGDVDGATISCELLEARAERIDYFVPIGAAHVRGSIALARADAPSALAAFERAATALDSFMDASPFLTVTILHDYGMLLRQMGRQADAQRVLERAMLDCKSVPPTYPARIAIERALAVQQARPPYR